MLVKVALTAPLTTSLGISGTAIASVASLGVMALINLYQFRKMMYKTSFVNFLKVSFSTAGLWLVLTYIEPQIPKLLSGLDDVRIYNMISLVIQVLAGVLVYAVLMGVFLMTSQAASRRSRKRKQKAKKKKARSQVKPVQTEIE